MEILKTFSREIERIIENFERHTRHDFDIIEKPHHEDIAIFEIDFL